MLSAGVIAGTAAGGVVLASTHTTGERAAMFAAGATVIGSLVGAAVAIVTSRRNTPPARFVDEPTSNELPRALSDLLEDALNDARQARDEATRAVRRAELWEGRARKLGWGE